MGPPLRHGPVTPFHLPDPRDKVAEVRRGVRLELQRVVRPRVLDDAAADGHRVDERPRPPVVDDAVRPGERQERRRLDVRGRVPGQAVEPPALEKEPRGRVPQAQRVLGDVPQARRVLREKARIVQRDREPREVAPRSSGSSGCGASSPGPRRPAKRSRAPTGSGSGTVPASRRRRPSRASRPTRRPGGGRAGGRPGGSPAPRPRGRPPATSRPGPRGRARGRHRGRCPAARPGRRPGPPRRGIATTPRTTGCGSGCRADRRRPPWGQELYPLSS